MGGTMGKGQGVTDLALPAVVGEIVVLAVIVAVVGAVFRELARTAIKVLLPVGLLVAVAVWLGLLEQTLVEKFLAVVGGKVLDGIRWVAEWAAATVSSG